MLNMELTMCVTEGEVGSNDEVRLTKRILLKARKAVRCSTRSFSVCLFTLEVSSHIQLS